MTKMTEHTIETSLTLDYRRERWGLERIVLDAISNHLPEDSNGTTVSIKLKQEGTYYTLETADKEKVVEEIIFEDDGAGYDYKLLTVLYSTKSADALSVGQFGEGLKMVAAATLRSNVHMQYQSRNWIAKPSVKNETIDDTPISRLCFDIDQDENNIVGSRTIFSHPRTELVEQIFQLPQHVLAFNHEYTVLYSEKHQKYNSQIINFPFSRPIIEDEFNYERRKLFIKGVKIQEIASLFDYNLGLEDITPDRLYAHDTSILNAIKPLILGCEEKEVIKSIIEEAKKNTNSFAYELRIFDEYRRLINLEESNVPTIPKRRYNNQIGLKLPSVKKEDITVILSPEAISESPPSTPSSLMDISAVIDFLKKGIGSKDEDMYIIKPKSLILKDYDLFDLDQFGDLNHSRNHLFAPTLSPLWKTTFYELYGQNAIIASGDTNRDADAERMGYIPIKLHEGLANVLIHNGIKSATQLAKRNEKIMNYHWIPLDQLTAEEQITLARIEKINKKINVPEPIEVRIYEGLYDWKDEEVKSEKSMCQTDSGGARYIGIRRSELATKQQFDPQYITRLGEYVTGKKLYEREGTDYYVETLARLLREKK